MKIYYRQLNKGEIYCCSVKKAKELFKETEAKLNFTHGGNEFEKNLEHPMYRYAKKVVKGKVIAHAIFMSGYDEALINFLGLPYFEYSQNLQKEFEENYLPEFYNLYIAQKNDQKMIPLSKLMIVELIDGKLKLHRTNLKY